MIRNKVGYEIQLDAKELTNAKFTNEIVSAAEKLRTKALAEQKKA